MASKLSLGRSRISKSVTITRTRPPNVEKFRRQMAACAKELVTHTISTLYRRARWEAAAPDLQQSHSVLRLQQSAFGFVRTREGRPRKDTRAVIRMLVAICAEHVVVGAILVVVLENIIRAWCPLDKLALLEFVQVVPKLACVLRMRHEEKQDVMKKVVCHEEPDHGRHDQPQYRDRVQESLLDAASPRLAPLLLSSGSSLPASESCGAVVYFGRGGSWTWATGVPQRGQWLQPVSSGFLQCAHAGSAAASFGGGAGSTSVSTPIPFLNSFIDSE